MGATFAYPDSLSAVEWVGLLSLGRAREHLKVTEKTAGVDPVRQSMVEHRSNLIAKAKGR